jgi:hypothetical protein
MTHNQLQCLYLRWTKENCVNRTISFVDFVEQNFDIVVEEKETYSFTPTMDQYRKLTTYCKYDLEDY